MRNNKMGLPKPALNFFLRRTFFSKTKPTCSRGINSTDLKSASLVSNSTPLRCCPHLQSSAARQRHLVADPPCCSCSSATRNAQSRIRQGTMKWISSG